jgi:hypothetical protein
VTIYEIRHDDDDRYFVVARFTDRGEANALRQRLVDAHHAADGDGCHFEGSWAVVPVDIDRVEPDVPLPVGLFHREPHEGNHAWVDEDLLPLGGGA